MQFVDAHTNREKRFSLGREVDSGRYYLSIPVSNRLVDYEEYYEISELEFSGYPANAPAIAALADLCRKRRYDQNLMVQPGSDRGVG